MEGHGGYRGGKSAGVESTIGRDFDRGRRNHRPYPQNRAQWSLGETGRALRPSVNQTKDGPADLPLASAKTGTGDGGQEDRRLGLLDQAGWSRAVLWIALVLTLLRSPDHGGYSPGVSRVRWIGQQMYLGGETIGWRSACDRGLETEARTCIESIQKLCRERGVWGGSREPPPAESITVPLRGTSPSGAWTSS